jgi:ABC-type microcin C transport system duplicated ATPase subunit YejF
MFIDEGLKEISTGVNAEGEAVNYLNNLLTFLKWLAETKEYSLVIITHDNTVKEFANSVYTVRKGKVEKC